MAPECTSEDRLVQVGSTFRLSESFVVLDREQGASRIAVGPTFWSSIERNVPLQTGRLLGAYSVSGASSFDSDDRSAWEMHPAGDELIFLLEGAMDMILEDAYGERAVALRGPGAACIVPRGVWHRQHFLERCTFGFITPGAGTRHR